MPPRSKKARPIRSPRFCPRCGEIKPPSKWYNEISSPLRRRPYCKECTQDWHREKYRKIDSRERSVYRYIEGLPLWRRKDMHSLSEWHDWGFILASVPSGRAKSYIGTVRMCHFNDVVPSNDSSERMIRLRMKYWEELEVWYSEMEKKWELSCNTKQHEKHETA